MKKFAKHIGKRSLALLLALLMCVTLLPMSAFAAEGKTEKFWVNVSSKLNDGSTTTVTGKVYDDYSAELVLPNAKVNAGNVTLEVGMKDVASLGVGPEGKSHSVTLNTGATAEGELASVLLGMFGENEALFNFKDATIKANIKNADGNNFPVTYELEGNSFDVNDPQKAPKVITGTPSEGVSEAWHAMVNKENFDISTQAADNSFVTVANGSWLQIGKEKLVFEKAGDLTVDPSNKDVDLVQTIKDAVKLEETIDSALAFTLKAGTALAVGSSIATLKNDVEVTVGGVDVSNLTVLSEIRAMANAETIDSTAIIKKLLDFMETAVKLVDDAAAVNVDIAFTKSETRTAKFWVDVSSKLSNGDVTHVTGTVYDDYSAELVLPNAKVNAGNVTVEVGMKNVASLGVGPEGKSHSVTLNTGATAEGELASVLLGMFEDEALFNFKDATINATIIPVEGDEKNVTYTLAGTPFNVNTSDRKTIKATASEGVSEAWHTMVNKENFDISTQAADNSYVVIANGSWLQIGKERLAFEKAGDLTVDPSNDADLVQTIKDAVKLEETDNSALAFTLKAGTTLAVGSSIATLKNDVEVTVGGVDVSNLTVLSEIRAMANAEAPDATAIIKKLLDFMETAVKLVDDAAAVDVEIKFVCANHTYAVDEESIDWNRETIDFVCTKCGQVETVNSFTSSFLHTKDGTCTTPAEYTQTVTFKVPGGEETYTATRIVTGVVDENNHDWGKWEVSDEPTCTNAGTETRVCKNNPDHTETRVVDPTGHTPVVDEAVAPTCTETGLTEGSHCSVCGHVIVAQEVVPATGHTEATREENRVEATCSAEGHYDEVVYCSVCNEVLSRTTQTIERLPHTAVTDAAVAATCTTTGLTEGSHCSVCNEVIVAQTVIPALGHNYVDGVCTRCGAEEGGTVIIPDPNPLGGELPFDDVTEADPEKGIKGDWFAPAVRYVYTHNELMAGVTENTFAPDSFLTRGQLVTILWRLEGSPAAGTTNFTDVAAGRYYTTAVAWANANGVVTGYSDTIFRPDRNVSRQEAAAILYRYAKLKNYDVTGGEGAGGLEDYTDAGTISDYAKDAMLWANRIDMISGRTETTLVPKGTTKRSEAAKILMQFCETYKVFPETETAE